ncbi:P-loop containing nucleoside triphosphate hydrolase protein, partial [Ramicandelaber brevisporus]
MSDKAVERKGFSISLGPDTSSPKSFATTENELSGAMSNLKTTDASPSSGISSVFQRRAGAPGSTQSPTAAATAAATTAASPTGSSIPSSIFQKRSVSSSGAPPAAAAAPAAPAAPAAVSPTKEAIAKKDSDDKAAAAADKDLPQYLALGLDEPTKNDVVIELVGVSEHDREWFMSPKSFEDLGLNPNLLKGLYEMNYTRPSKIQAHALPLLLANPPRNLIGQSQSGTGKTAAFVLTMLSRVDYEEKYPGAICLAPTRELAIQIDEVCRIMGKYTPVKTVLAVAGNEYQSGRVEGHIVIGTPGSVRGLLEKKKINPNRVRLLVLDEADNLLDKQSLGDQSIMIRAQMSLKHCQFVAFSATFDERIMKFAETFAPKANKLTLAPEELTVDNVRQIYMNCATPEDRVTSVAALFSLRFVGQTIVFVERRVDADKLSEALKKDGHKVASLHGAITPEERDQIMAEFRNGRCPVLISTNVLARGIDHRAVGLVINFDLPRMLRGNDVDFTTYLHRIGRTGRFGRVGISVNFVYDSKSKADVQSIEDHFGKKIHAVETDDWEETA